MNMSIKKFLSNILSNSRINQASDKQERDHSVHDDLESVFQGPGMDSTEAKEARGNILHESSISITKENLLEFDNFVRDADFKQDKFPKWRTGQKLQKSGAILIGTSLPFKPKYKVRFNIFAKDAFRALEGNDDPWNLVAIDREAFFTVADVYDHGDLIQFTLVEIDQDQLNSKSLFVLDEEVRGQVRHELIDSYFVAIPPFANDPLYKELMGNEVGSCRLDPFWEIDEPENDLGREEYSLKINDPRIEILYQVQQKDETYCLFMEISEKRSDTPNIYKQIYIAKKTANNLKIIGIGQPLMASLCDSFIEDCLVRPEMSEYILKITNRGKLASGNINLPKKSGSPKRIASWVRDPAGVIKVDYFEGFEQPKTEFIDFSELLLYLFVFIAYPFAMREESIKAKRADVLRLDDSIPYSELNLTNGLIRIQAQNKNENTHPSLEFLESQQNTNKILHSTLERRAIAKLYEGNIVPTYKMVKDLIFESIWLNPFTDVWIHPLPSDCSNELFETLEEMRAETKTAEEAEKLNTMAKELEAAFRGDVKTSVNRILTRLETILLPYRYTFSLGFDEDLRQAMVNLYLPEPELFPMFTVKDKDYATYKPTILDPISRRNKYNEFFAKLCMLTLTLVKASAPWYTTIALNAWLHHDDAWTCVGSGEFPEERICKLVEADQLKALARMRSIGMKYDKSKDGCLNAIEPCFGIESGQDFRFGFAFASEDGLIPEWHPIITKDGSFEDLTVALDRIKNITDPGNQIYLPLDELKTITESCYVKALAENNNNPQLLSCSCDMEEAMLARDPKTANATFIGRGLSKAFSLIGANLINKGEVDEAHEKLVLALELNPMNYHALHELVALSVMKKDWEKAKRLLSQCCKYAFTNEMLSFALRQYGFINIEEGDIEIAKDLLVCALAIDSDDQNVTYCMNELAGIGAFDKENSDCIRLNVELSQQRAEAAGYMTRLDSSIQEIVRSFLEGLESGKRYPDQSVGEAFLSLGFGQEGLDEKVFDIENVTKVFECILGAKIGVFPIFDYIYMPVIVPSRTICLSALAGNEDDEVALLCTPYIDRKMGVQMQVVGLVDSRDFSFKRTMKEPKTIKVRSCMVDYWSVFLRDFSDYPEIDLLSISKNLMENNLPSIGVDRTRAIREIDGLRDYENPDTILVVLRGRGFAPEAMWAEAEDVVGDEMLVRLLSEPYDDFGVGQGDIYPIVLEEHPDTGMPIAFVDCDQLK